LRDYLGSDVNKLHLLLRLQSGKHLEMKHCFFLYKKRWRENIKDRAFLCCRTWVYMTICVSELSKHVCVCVCVCVCKIEWKWGKMEGRMTLYFPTSNDVRSQMGINREFFVHNEMLINFNTLRVLFVIFCDNEVIFFVMKIFSPFPTIGKNNQH
jgi:hypothetical protein